jgi:UDP-N-acetylmuramate dehydrogenase
MELIENNKNSSLLSEKKKREKFLIDNEFSFSRNFDISKKSFIKAGGICNIFVQPHSLDQFIVLIRFLRSNERSFKVVGNLSNLLFQGGIINTIIISTRKLGQHGYVGNDKYYMETGTLLPRQSKLLSRAGYLGFSGLVGIPGTIGGAIFMNAGAYDCQISDNLKYVTCINENSEICELSKDELSFGWRSSAFQETFKKYIILSAVFELRSGDLKSIQAHMDAVSTDRKTYQESRYPNLGSTFATKDIYGDLSKYYFFYRVGHIMIKILTKMYFGNKNICYAKWMNKYSQIYFHLKPTSKVGFSDKTFNCVINRGGASGNELAEFIAKIQRAIEFKIPLEVEIFHDQVGSSV